MWYAHVLVISEPLASDTVFSSLCQINLQSFAIAPKFKDTIFVLINAVLTKLFFSFDEFCFYKVTQSKYNCIVPQQWPKQTIKGTQEA